jgi:hypothetical protein
MQPSKVQKTPQKPTICPCGSTANAPKSKWQSTFDAGVTVTKKINYTGWNSAGSNGMSFSQNPIMRQPPKVQKTAQNPTICPYGSTAYSPKSMGQSAFDVSAHYDATVKSPKNAAKIMPTPQNRGGKVLLTLASIVAKIVRGGKSLFRNF